MQGLMVGPTPKPPDLLRSILFNRYDLPVLYIPATDIIPIGEFNYFKKSPASSFISNAIWWKLGIGSNIYLYDRINL